MDYSYSLSDQLFKTDQPSQIIEEYPKETEKHEIEVKHEFKNDCNTSTNESNEIVINNSENNDEDNKISFHCPICNKQFIEMRYVVLHLEQKHVGFLVKIEPENNNSAHDAVESENKTAEYENLEYLMDEEINVAEETELINDIKFIGQNEEKDIDMNINGLSDDENIENVQIEQNVEYQDNFYLMCMYKCNHCERKFTRKQYLRQHCQWSHPDLIYFDTENCIRICSICSNSFDTYTLFYNHYQLHFPDSMVKCPQCEQLFPNRTECQIHEKTHSTRIVNSCAHCTFRSISKESLEVIYHDWDFKSLYFINFKINILTCFFPISFFHFRNT